ncbi:uncharacterized protein DUF4397 [Halospina denitrificans]|uniref:Uncharacterized protein DUF4397 n=1 Tax=Halospina denitrificans TaxID=332522 RepID=A0A4R7JZY1_9GAMM|nr:DUF4397 domain-containing protein [Halospina denitrificans]TDT43133.1 uncharacterized protein DUF4397 [Halospina denitrificans]
MGARFTLTLVVVMAAGLGGCFESQRDETFEDTVVLDDVDVRVLNAMADAPELTLDVDDEARAEALGYAETGDFTLPANHYRFRVRGDTGHETLATLLDGAQDNLEEDKRYDLILTGHLNNDSQQVVLFGEDDETFEGETQEERDAENEENDPETDDSPLEQVRLRAAHLIQGADPVDLYLDDEPGQALDGDREPDATLGFASRSEPLLVEKGVYRLRLTEAGNQQNVIYDSGSRLDFEMDQDLLLAAVPNTGIDNADHPVSLVVLDELETRVFPHNDQQGGIQFVHAAEGLEDPVDVLVDETVLADEVVFPDVEPGSGPLGYELSSANDYEVEVIDSATAEDDDPPPPVANKNVRVNRGRGLSAVLVESEEDPASEEIIVLNNDDRPVVTNARVRVVHAAGGIRDKNVDIYVLPPDQSLSEDGTVQEPWVSGLGYLGRSGYRPVPENTDYKLVVTASGDSEDRLLEESPISLENGGNYRLIISGDDGTSDPVHLIRLGGVR